MQREDVRSLYYIAHMDNAVSIALCGILSHYWSQRLFPNNSKVAEPAVQNRRASVRFDDDVQELHRHVNLYLNPRNLMLYRLMSESHDDICIFGVSPEVLDIKGTKVTSRNAAADGMTWNYSPDGLALVDGTILRRRERCYKDWAQIQQAEVLVPDRVPPELITQVFVCCEGNKNRLLQREQSLMNVAVNRACFYSNICPEVIDLSIG